MPRVTVTVPCVRALCPPLSPSHCHCPVRACALSSSVQSDAIFISMTLPSGEQAHGTWRVDSLSCAVLVLCCWMLAGPFRRCYPSPCCVVRWASSQLLGIKGYPRSLPSGVGGHGTSQAGAQTLGVPGKGPWPLPQEASSVPAPGLPPLPARERPGGKAPDLPWCSRGGGGALPRPPPLTVTPTVTQPFPSRALAFLLFRWPPSLFLCQGSIPSTLATRCSLPPWGCDGPAVTTSRFRPVRAKVVYA